MMVAPKGFFTKLFEAAILFAISAWLIKAGICLLYDVRVQIILFIAVFLVVRAILIFRKHYKETHDF